MEVGIDDVSAEVWQTLMYVSGAVWCVTTRTRASSTTVTAPVRSTKLAFHLKVIIPEA